MTGLLETYLADHLAGAAGGIDLLAGLTRKHRGTPDSATLRELLAEIRADERTLRTLAIALGAKPRRPRRLLGKLTGKLLRARVTAVAGTHSEFALFEGLELLGIGILGKRALWRALREVASLYPPIKRLRLNALESRADDQYARVERLRLNAARRALAENVGRVSSGPSRSEVLA